MHFAYGPVEIGDCLAPVQHGRQFDQCALRFGEQQITQFEHVWRAILNRVGARAMLVAAGRIKVDKVHRIHLPEVFHAVAAHDTRLVKSQCGHVVLGQIAQVPLPFHISGLAESARQIREIHAEPARQIHHRPFRHQCVRFWRIGHPRAHFHLLRVRFSRIGHSGAYGCGRLKQGLCDFGLVLGGELRRALFHGNVRRVYDSLAGGPLWQFFACDLPSGDLVERQWQVESVHTLGFQRQFAHVLVAIHRHEFARLVIHDCHW